jgi:uncharacterized protein (DUF58 family)
VKLFKTLYLNNRLFFAIGMVVGCFVVSFIINDGVIVGKILFFILLAVAITDLILLYRTRTGIRAERMAPEKLSNGDNNEIVIVTENLFAFSVSLRVIDEIPHQFQKRDLDFYCSLKPGSKHIIKYYLRPVKRGQYDFGSVNIFASSPISFFTRRFVCSSNKIIPVYPSYIQMRKYELFAISNRLSETGVKKIRRIGHNMEFEQIKEYVVGDEYRTINWKATARRSALMVNHYQDERSQPVYSLIDKGRVMQMPFEGLSLLDYAINASLVISNIAIRKSDKAGLLTFQNKISAFLPASRSTNQMSRILELLYNEKTAYRETDFSAVYGFVKKKITQRSLLLLYTNFESVQSMRRQLPYLQNLSRQHLLVVIFFENTEMEALLHRKATDLREVYHKAVAEKFAYERRLIVKQLKNNGIHSILTPPKNLTVNTINKYLELKARGLI